MPFIPWHHISLSWNGTLGDFISSDIFMNKNSGRSKTLSWYFTIVFQSHNNKNDHQTRCREGPDLNAWASRFHYLRKSDKQLLLWKILSANNEGLPLCWLTLGPEFTYFQIFTSKFSIKFSVSYEKGTTKDSEARQFIKLWPTRIILNQNDQNCYLKPGIDSHRLNFKH